MATSRTNRNQPNATPADVAATKDFLDNIERSQKAANLLDQEFIAMQSTVRGLGVELKEAFLKQVPNATKEVKEYAKSLDSSLKTQIRETEKFAKTLSKNQRTLTSEATIKSQILETERRRESIVELLDEAAVRGYGLNQKQLDAAKALLDTLNEQDEVLANQLSKVKAMEKTIGRMATILKGIQKIPFVGGFLGQLMNIPKALKAMEKAAAGGASKLKTMWVGLKQVFANIGIGLALAALTKGVEFLVKAIVEVDRKAFDLAANLGTNVKQAEELNKKFILIATSSANTGLTAKELTKTYTELSNTVGYLVPSNREFSETAALIQKRIGASAEQMSALAMQSVLSKQSIGDTYKTLEKSRVVEGARNKLSLTTKQILESIAKTSSTVLINFKGSTEALANAVIRAAKLGTTLDQVNKQGEALVDFESSIEKEFEAQLLTGRNINLTRARELALMGKTKELMEELKNQQVSYDSFMNETIIGRRSEAEAIGLSVEELSKQLLLQKQAELLGAKEGESLQERYNLLIKEGKTREDIAKLITEGAEKDLYRASIADKFNNSVERLKDILGTMLEGPLKGVVDSFANFVSDGNKMTNLANQLKGIFTGLGKVLQNLPSLLSAAIGAMRVLATLSIVSAVANVVASLGATPFVGAALGIAAGIGTNMWLNSLLDGGNAATPPMTNAPSNPSMTTPVNPVTATAQQSATTSENKSDQTKAPVFVVNSYIGTEKLATATTKAIQQYPGTTIV